MNPEVLYHLLTLAFGAGGVFFLIKQNRSEVSALEHRFNVHLSKSNARHQNLALALMSICTEAQKEKIAELLRAGNENGRENG